MELKEQKFGIEIEMTGITRAKAAEVTAEYFGTRVKYLGTITIPMQPLTRRAAVEVYE